MNKDKKKFLINLFGNIIVFLTQVLINFLLVPFISTQIGDEAVGFTSLATNIINYGTIITAALNGMAGRFITVAYHKKKFEDSNQYFVSVLIMNILFSSILTILVYIFVINIQYLLNISPELVSDVRLTFIFVCINMCILLIDNAFSVATFIKNRLELSAIKFIIANIIKVITILLLFKYLPAKMFYQGLATIFSSIIIICFDIIYTKKLIPEIKISIKDFRKKKIIEILKEGIWNSVTKVSEILLTGIDLLIANIMVGAHEMGLLAIAKTVPQAVVSLTSAIASAFYPKCAYYYSTGNKDLLVKCFKKTISMETIIILVPMVGLIFFGMEFYSLWLPEKNMDEIKIIQILSILTLIYTLGNGLVEGLYYANTLTKKIKNSVLITMGIGILSTVLVFIALKFTNYGVYAIAAVSSVLMLFRALIITPIYCSNVLKIKWNYFFSELSKSLICLIIIFITFYFMTRNLHIYNWISFIVNVGIAGLIGYIEVFIVYSKDILKKFFIKEVQNEKQN